MEIKKARAGFADAKVHGNVRQKANGHEFRGVENKGRECDADERQPFT